MGVKERLGVAGADNQFGFWIQTFSYKSGDGAVNLVGAEEVGTADSGKVEEGEKILVKAGGEREVAGFDDYIFRKRRLKDKFGAAAVGENKNFIKFRGKNFKRSELAGKQAGFLPRRKRGAGRQKEGEVGGFGWVINRGYFFR